MKFFSHTPSTAGATWLFFALALGLFTRTYFLSQPMRGDESYTFLIYVNSNLLSLFDYSAPNNHVLNTLLIKLTIFLFGGSPATIRLPAFAAGLAAIVLVFYLSQSLDKNPNAGIFAAVTTALFPYLILYSTNARGYALIVALTLLLAWLGQRFLANPSTWGVFWLALCSALGMLAIPTMLFPIAGIFFWLLALLLLKRTSLKTVLRQFVLPYGLLSGIFTVIFYAPVVIVSKGLDPIISNKFVASQGWDVFFADLPLYFQKSFEELFNNIPVALVWLIFALALFGFIGAVATRNWGLLLILPSMLVGAASILLVQRAIPYARIWIYLLPFILLLADAGLLFLLKHLPGRIQGSIKAILIVSALFFAVNLTSNNTISTYGSTTDFPEAAIAVQYLKPIFKPGDTLRASPSADLPVYFYFWYHGMSSTLNDGSAPSTGRVFFIRKKSRGPLSDEALQKYTLLLDIGNMALYQGTK